MKLWISSEIEADIFEPFRVSSLKVEDSINDVISNKAYGLRLNGWDCIAIIRNDDNFEEIIKYSHKKKDMDFRLKINYQDFLNGNELDKEKFVFSMLLRSLKLLEEKGLFGSGMDDLKKDVLNVGLYHGWV